MSTRDRNGQSLLLTTAEAAERLRLHEMTTGRMLLRGELRGVMVATFVPDRLGLNDQGEHVPVEWEPFDEARRIVAAVRECVALKLAGQPLL